VTERVEHEWVDERAAPLYVWRIPPAPSTPEIEEALAAIQRWVATLDEPYGWINDPRGLQIRVVATHRALLAEHLKIVAPEAERWCAGMATIATSSAIRGVGTAVGWVTPYGFPTKWCGSLDEAWPWVRERVMERGGPPIPSAPPRRS
jgi:hypothetical protein